MDERELRAAFHAAYDGARPRPDAPDRAFAAVAESGARAHSRGRRLAGGPAIALALLLVAVLQVQRGGFAPPGVRSTAGAPAASTPVATPAAAPLPSASPASGVGTPNRPYPEVVAAVGTRVALAGWASTGGIRLTTDGGASWTAVRPATGTPAPVLDLQWVDDDVAFVATAAGLYRFQRSAAAWTRLSRRPDLVRIDFRDRVTGYAVTAAGDVVETDDGGQTLSAREVGIHPVTWLQWVSSRKAWAAGPQGIVATSDGGATWATQLALPAQAGVTVSAQVGFRDESNGFALFDAAGAGLRGAVLYHTSDGGATWAARTCTCEADPFPTWLRGGAGPGLPGTAHGALVVTGAAQASVVTTGEAASPASICATNDGGATWGCQRAPFATGTGALTVKGRTWLLAAETPAGQVLYVSQDAGASWTTRGV